MDEEVKDENKKKGNVLIITIVASLAVIILLVIAALAWLILGSSSNEQIATPATENKVDKPKATNTMAQRGSDFANIGPMYPLAPFTLNLLSDSGARYVKCTVQLEQNNELLQAELDKKTAIIRDIIIRTLTSKTYEEVSTTKGKERLKDELVGRVNEILTDGFVKNIYFTDFVVQ